MKILMLIVLVIAIISCVISFITAKTIEKNLFSDEKSDFSILHIFDLLALACLYFIDWRIGITVTVLHAVALVYAFRSDIVFVSRVLDTALIGVFAYSITTIMPI